MLSRTMVNLTPLRDYDQHLILNVYIKDPVILLHAHSASFAHNFVSGMQSFYFSEYQDAIVSQTCH